jgi:tetratricopeptide (TPR) repeat protein
VNAPATDKIALYEAMLEADPANTLIRLNLYDLYHRSGRFDEAAAGFEACADDPEYGRTARGNLAKVRLSQGECAAAESLLEALLDEDGQDPALLYNLGIARYCQQRWEEAEQAFTAARDAGLTLGDNLRYLAFSLHQQKKTEDAQAAVQQWLDLGPSDEAEGYRAVLELDMGNLAAAEAAAEAALAQNPDNVDANWVKSVGFMDRQEMDRAERLLKRILDKQPDSFRALNGLGMVYYYRREFDKSISFMERAMQVSPKQVGPLVTIGWAHLAKKDVHGAENAFRRAIGVEPKFGESHGGLAVALALQNRVDEAQRAIKLARRLDRRSFGAIYAQSILIATQGKPDLAAKIVERALRQSLGPDAPDIEESIARYVRKQGMTPPAEASTPPPDGE